MSLLSVDIRGDEAASFVAQHGPSQIGLKAIRGRSVERSIFGVAKLWRQRRVVAGLYAQMTQAVVKRYLDWRRGPPVGCVFARLISIRPDAYKQVIDVVPCDGAPSAVAAMIAARIDARVSDGAAAVAVLLPQLTALESLAKISVELGKLPKWHLSTSTLLDPPAGPMVAVHITRDLELGGELRPSEALVLGPFGEFPPTRRAPVTALEIFTGEPMANDPKTGKPTTRANLAHMRLPMHLPKVIQTMWKKSIDGRKRSLGNKEDSRAKARVSFVVPASLGKKVGWGP